MNNQNKSDVIMVWKLLWLPLLNVLGFIIVALVLWAPLITHAGTVI